VATPTNKDQCKKGGWRQFGFKNQGQCIAFVNHLSHAGGPPTTSTTTSTTRTNDKDQCKDGGWQQLGFKNQGQCIASSNHDAHSSSVRARLAGYVRPHTSSGNVFLALVVGLGLFGLSLALPVRRRRA